MVTSYSFILMLHHSIKLKYAYCYKDRKTRPISDGFRKNNVNYWAFREIRSIIPHL